MPDDLRDTLLQNTGSDIYQAGPVDLGNIPDFSKPVSFLWNESYLLLLIDSAGWESNKITMVDAQ